MKVILKIILVFIHFLFFNICIYGQLEERIYITLDVAFQKIDNRHVGVSSSVIEIYDNLNNENQFNLTKQFGVCLGYKIVDLQKLDLGIGFGYSREVTKFIRYFNHLALGENSYKLLSLDKYYYDLLNLRLDINYILNQYQNYNIKVGLNLCNEFRINSFYNSQAKYLWNKRDFFSIEFNPQIGIQYNRFEFDIYYRLFQIKKIDRALFIKNDTGYGSIKKDFETFNPIKFGISFIFWI